MIDMGRVFEEKANTVIKKAMKSREATQVMMAEKMGMLQSGFSSKLMRPRMSVEFFAEALDILGYDVIISDRESGEEVWKVDVEK